MTDAPLDTAAATVEDQEQEEEVVPAPMPAVPSRPAPPGGEMGMAIMPAAPPPSGQLGLLFPASAAGVAALKRHIQDGKLHVTKFIAYTPEHPYTPEHAPDGGAGAGGAGAGGAGDFPVMIIVLLLLVPAASFCVSLGLCFSICYDTILCASCKPCFL